MSWKKLRLGIVCVSAAILVFLTIGIGREQYVSQHEASIALQVESRGGLAIRNIETTGLLNFYKAHPVIVTLKDDNIVRISRGMLGTRILTATFYPEADREFAVDLSKSTSLSGVILNGKRGDQLRPPLAMLPILQKAPIKQIQFRLYSFELEDVRDLLTTLKVPWVQFAECTMPSEALAELGNIPTLKGVEFVVCNFTGKSENVTKAFESLRSAGIEVANQ